MADTFKNKDLQQQVIKLEKKVTQLERDKKYLKKKNAQYNDIIKNLNDFVFIHDIEGNIFESNLNSMTGLGYSHKDLSDLNIKDLLPDRIKPKFKKYLNSVITHGKNTGITKLKRKDGQERYIEYRNFLLHDSSENPERIIGSFKDISPRKEAEKINHALMAISNSVNKTYNLNELYFSIHQSLSKIIDTTNFYIALYDEENDAVTFPYTVDTVDNYDYPPLLNISKSEFFSLTFHVIKNGKPLLLNKDEQLACGRSEKKSLKGTPSEVWLGVPLKIKNLTIGVMAVQSYTDAHRFDKKDMEILSAVSDQISLAIHRKLSEEALIESEGRYRNMIENINDIIFSRDCNGHLLYLSPAVENITGYAQKELIKPSKTTLETHHIDPQKNIDSSDDNFKDTYFDSIIHPDDLEMVAQKVNSGIKQKGSYQCTYRIISKKGQQRWLYEKGRTIEGKNDNKWVEGIIVDVNRQKHAEQINKTLLAIANAVNTTFNLDELYRSIHKSLSRIIDTRNFFIALYDQDEDFLYFPYHVDEKDEVKDYDGNQTISNASQSNSLTIEVIKNGKPFFKKHSRENSEINDKKGFGTPCQQWLGVPLKVQNRVIGTMAVQSYSDPDRYNQKDADILQAVSGQVATAIERKQAEETIRSNEKKIMTLSRQTEQFSLAAASMITTKDDKTIFKLISNAIIKNSDFNKVVISYFQDNSADREIIGVGGLTDEEISKLKKIKLPKNEYSNWLDQCKKIGQYSYYLPHKNKHVIDSKFAIRSKENDTESSTGWHSHDMLFVRMNDEQGELIGGISVDDSKTGRRPTADTVRPLEVFSSLISQIIINKKRERERKMTEAKYRTILENIEDGYYEVDVDGYFTFVSNITCHIFEQNRNNLLGMSYRKLMDEREAEIVYQLFHRTFVSGITQKSHTAMIKTKNGKKKNIEVSVTPIIDEKNHTIGFRGIVRDVTERIKTEEELKKYHNQLEELVNERTVQLTKVNKKLQQTQKMESIGTLAGGIAHDFNNILSSIIGYTELALDDTLPDTLLRMNLREVLIAGNRAKELVQQILTFSRQTDQELKPIKVKPIVKEALKMIRATLPSTITVEQNIMSGSLIMADPINIHQIIVNLCTNAAHSMKKDGGILRVNLENIKPDSEITEKFVDIKPGKYLKLSVADTGHGIPSHIMDRIFDPFFTTKKQNEGTGMGLSMVHGIVKSLKGIIVPESEPVKGTVFDIYLPVIEPGIETKENLSKPSPAGNETILFVDDEPALLKMGQQMLIRLGYTVEIRSSSIEALELFKNSPEKFDLIITDMIMPNMTGTKLARKILNVRPNMPMILCTGFSEEINDEKAKVFGFQAFVTKPILKHEIAETIRKVLDH